MQTQTQSSTAAKTAVVVSVLFAAGGIAAAALMMSVFRRPVLNMDIGRTTFSTEAVKGSTEVTFLEFAAIAPNGPVQVTDLTFTAYGDDDADFSTIENGVEVQDHVTSCSMYAADGSLIDGPEPIDGAGKLLFTLAWSPTMRATQAIVKCNLANVDPEGTGPDIFGLALASDADVVALETRTGTVMPPIAKRVGRSDAGINTNLLAQNVRVVDHGTLSAELSSDSPEGDIVLAGSTEVLLGRWTFTSTGEPFAISRLMFTNTASITPLYEVELRYQDATGSTITLTEPAGDWVYFEGLTLEVNGTSDIELYANAIRPADGSVSGNRVGYALDFAEPGFAGGGTISAVNALDAGIDGEAIPSSEYVVYATKPTLSLASGSPSGAAVAGLRSEIFRFNVAVDSRGEMGLKQVAFKIDAVDNGGSGWNNCGDGTHTAIADESVWDIALASDPSDVLNPDGAWSFLNTAGEECSTETEPLGYVIFTLEEPLEIPAGATEAILLSYNSFGASSVDDDSILVSISATDELEAAGVWPIMWNDGFSDADETFVDALPVIGGTIAY